MTNEKVVKITKKDRFNQLLAIEEVNINDELVAFIEHELELLDKKAKSSKKVDENKAKLLNALYDEMLEIKEYRTVSEILKDSTVCEENGIVSQKLTPMLKALAEQGKMDNKKEGKKSLYKAI